MSTVQEFYTHSNDSIAIISTLIMGLRVTTIEWGNNIPHDCYHKQCESGLFMIVLNSQVDKHVLNACTKHRLLRPPNLLPWQVWLPWQQPYTCTYIHAATMYRVYQVIFMAAYFHEWPKHSPKGFFTLLFFMNPLWGELLCKREPNNAWDTYTVAVIKDDRVVEVLRQYTRIATFEASHMKTRRIN